MLTIYFLSLSLSIGFVKVENRRRVFIDEDEDEADEAEEEEEKDGDDDDDSDSGDEKKVDKHKGKESQDVVSRNGPPRHQLCIYNTNPSEFLVKLLEMRHYNILPSSSHQLIVLFRGMRPKLNLNPNS